MSGMAKKRSTQTSTRGHSTTRHSSKRGSDMPDWKKSKLLAGVLFLVIIVCLYFMISNATSSGGSSTIPSNFPRTYLAVEDAGNYGAVLEYRSSKPPELPIEKDGKKYYDAYICQNEKCPGRGADGKPYIFAILPPPPMPAPGPDGAAPQGAPEMMPGMPELFCPLCKKKYDSVKPKDQAQYDPTHIERYQTEEAIQMINKIREEFMKKNK